MQACTLKPSSAADMLPVLFKRTLDLHQTTFAMGESVAHLHMLWFAGRLQRTLGADGVYRFAPNTPSSIEASDIIMHLLHKQIDK